MSEFQIILVSDYSIDQGLPSYLYKAFADTLGSENVSFIGEEQRTYSTDLFTRAKRKFDIVSGRLSAFKSKRLLDSLNSKKKNIIIFFNTSGLSAADLNKICSIPGVFSVHYCSDHPYGMFSPNREITLSTAGYFDLIITMSEQLKPVFYQLGAKWVERLPFAYCRYNHLLPTEKLPAENTDTVFYFGTWTAEIESWLEPLLEFDLHIEGSHWYGAKNKSLREKGMKGPFKADSNMAIAARKAGAVVNFTRAPHGCFHTMKTFELAISGAAIATNFSMEQEEFFKPEACFKYFDTKQQMKDSIKFILSHPDFSAGMRENCRTSALPHSYHSRVDTFLKILQQKGIIAR